MDNLIDEFIKTEEKYVDTTELFFKGSAYWTISSTLGVFSEYLEAPVGARRPNIYIILTSAPAGRRSTIMSHSRKIHKAAWRTFLRGETREESIPEIINNKFFREFSIEGVIDGINETKIENKYLDYNLVSGEFGVYVSRTQNTKYLQSSLGFLSDIYYGEDYIQNYSTKGTGRRYLQSGVYFTLFGGTQKMNEYFDARHIRQGFMRRLIIVPASSDDFKRYLPYLSHGRYSMDESFQKVGEKITQRMNELKGKKDDKTMIKFEKKPLDEINKIDKKMQMYARSNDEKSYFISGGEILTKLCALTALADINNERSSAGFIVVDKNHLDYTLPFFNESMKRTVKVIEEILLPKANEYLDVFDKRKARIIKNIIDADNWISNITKKTGKTHDTLRDILNTLIDEKEVFGVFIRKSGSKKKGEMNIYYTCDRVIALEKIKIAEEKGLTAFMIEPKDFLSLYK